MIRGTLAALLAACGAPPPPAPLTSSAAPLSLAADDRMITIPAGPYISGSTPEERATAYDDYRTASGHDAARERRWFEGERPRAAAHLPTFRLDLMPVTQAQYAELVATGAVPPPTISSSAWKSQGFNQDYATEVTRFLWTSPRPPLGREEHPVVLITWDEARRYCHWRGTLRGQPRRLPTSAELEKAARGEAGLFYPWGNLFEADKLNSAALGPDDTVPVGSFPAGASPYGILDLAGNVFHWTSTRFDSDEMVVKGSAWEDHPGVGRGASFHGRPPGSRHVIVGFRCAADG